MSPDNPNEPSNRPWVLNSHVGLVEILGSQRHMTSPASDNPNRIPRSGLPRDGSKHRDVCIISSMGRGGMWSGRPKMVLCVMLTPLHRSVVSVLPPSLSLSLSLAHSLSSSRSLTLSLSLSTHELGHQPMINEHPLRPWMPSKPWGKEEVCALTGVTRSEKGLFCHGYTTSEAGKLSSTWRYSAHDRRRQADSLGPPDAVHFAYFQRRRRHIGCDSRLNTWGRRRV